MKRRIIAVGNAAGSAGKTTTVVSLAALYAKAGRKVLVVDADAQANATRWLGVDPTGARFVVKAFGKPLDVIEASWRRWITFQYWKE